MDLIQKTVEASTSFENADRKLKKEYLLKNINTFKKVTEVLPGFRGAFGLGYPFYALGKDLEGELPYIKEQIRYNNKLLDEFLDNSYDNVWHCEKCLQANMDNMPDLKKVCYKCPVVPKKIKPRKVINRLPDMDFCLVVEDGYEEVSKIKLLDIFDKNGFYTSDVNPLKTINDVYEISEDLKKGEMPSKFVPIDVHLFSYEELYMLIEKVGEVIQLAEENGIKAYLPTLPDSLRKR